jgi:hypothetical protein
MYCQYKVAENYLVQEIIIGCYPLYEIFFGIYQYAHLGDYYVTSEKNVIDFFKCDNVDKNKLTLLLKFDGYYFKLGEQIKDSIFGNKWVNSLLNMSYILRSNDVEVYKIGGGMYAIRKIRYAYLDSIDMYAKEYRLKYEYGRDDIHIPDDADTITLKSVKEFYNVDYYQCFLFMMELPPTNKKILKHLWKRRYEFLELMPSGSRVSD